jgi:hypothetical protein
VGRNINTWLKYTPLLSTTFQVVIAGGVNALASDNSTVVTAFFPSDSAWVHFLTTIGLTRQQLLDNGPLVQKLARTMFVPHVALVRPAYAYRHAILSHSRLAYLLCSAPWTSRPARSW